MSKFLMAWLISHGNHNGNVPSIGLNFSLLPFHLNKPECKHIVDIQTITVVVTIRNYKQTKQNKETKKKKKMNIKKKKKKKKKTKKHQTSLLVLQLFQGQCFFFLAYSKFIFSYFNAHITNLRFHV